MDTGRTPGAAPCPTPDRARPGILSRRVARTALRRASPSGESPSRRHEPRRLPPARVGDRRPAGSGLDRPEVTPTEGRDIMREVRSRRGFMRDGSMAAAALTGLTTLNAEGKSAEGTAYLCVTCGTQFPESPKPPERCAICEDERQYVGPDGQQWTTLGRLRTTHKNTIKKEEEGL